MELRRGGGALATAMSCGGGAVLEVPLNCGGGVVVTGPLEGAGGGSGHTADPGGPTSLAPSLGARVSVGRPRGPIWIHAVCLYGDLDGVDSGIGMTSIGLSSLSMTATTTTSSSSSSSSSTTSSLPSPSPGDENTGCHCATGYEHGPVPWKVHGGSR
jgi:hypothetical protein